MSVGMSAGTASPQKERKTRKSHSKVKTRCLTCKIRKKKCDETKPFCLRCVNTGRKCDGYDLSPAGTVPSKGTPVQGPKKNFTREPSLLITPRNPFALVLKTDAEIECFNYFRLVTGPRLGSYLDSSIWRTFIITAALSHPVVLKAAAAVGAAHQRFNLGITPEAFRYCDLSSRLQKDALKFHHEFDLPNNEHMYEPEVAMVTSTLFVLFETFQGNYNNAFQHMAHGLGQLWDRPGEVTHYESQHRQFQVRSTLFRDLFRKFRSRAVVLFGKSPSILTSPQESTHPPVLPSTFASLADALNSIYTEIHWVLYTRAHLWQSSSARERAQRMYVARLLKWSTARANTIATLAEHSAHLKREFRLLTFARNMTYVLLYLVLFAGQDQEVHPETTSSPLPEEDQDLDRNRDQLDPLLDMANTILRNVLDTHPELHTNLNRVCILADAFLDDSSPFAYEEHSISFASAIGPPRHSEPGPKASSKARHLVQSLLSGGSSSTGNRNSPDGTRPYESKDDHTSPGTNSINHEEEDLYDKMGAYSIAETISSIEEHAVFLAANKIIPIQDLNPEWIEITCFVEDRKVLVRYCHRPITTTTNTTSISCSPPPDDEVEVEVENENEFCRFENMLGNLFLDYNNNNYDEDDHDYSFGSTKLSETESAAVSINTEDHSSMKQTIGTKEHGRNHGDGLIWTQEWIQF